MYNVLYVKETYEEFTESIYTDTEYLSYHCKDLNTAIEFIQSEYNRLRSWVDKCEHDDPESDIKLVHPIELNINNQLFFSGVEYTTGKSEYPLVVEKYLLLPSTPIDEHDHNTYDQKRGKLDSIKVYLDAGAKPPIRAFEDDAGLDLCTPFFVMVPANSRTVVNTGVHVSIPAGYVGKLESKSGLMRKKGITCRGTIDAGYTGSITAIVFNHSDVAVSFEPGEKIAQLVIYPIETPELKFVGNLDDLGSTERGASGFGSTGK